nr:Uma2 family endonuclease [Chloroflexaceae bacterium]
SERLAAVLRDGKLYGAPELVVEVLSPGSRNISRDREAKLKLYSRRGVDEYWIVDWQQHAVDVLRRDGDLLVSVVSLRSGDVLTSPLLPGFELSLDLLFDGVPFGVVEADESDER